ncbi:MAG TPA: RecX family transcriptional regulator [Chloroflexi bacterium]|nr:RecX family transcriptional regulator [Chloroflexota bacterium]
MTGKITTLVIQKKNKERVNLFLDDAFAFGISLDAALNLKKGQFLSDEEIARLKFDDQAGQAYQKSLNFLSYRARSKQEIKQYLQKKGFGEEAVEEAIERLADKGYLNDVEFGQLWVENRNRFNPKGKTALRYELRAKGLSEADIEEALDGLDEENLAWQAVQKQLTRWQALDKLTFKQKLSSHLARRGFSYDIIQTVVVRAGMDKD